MRGKKEAEYIMQLEQVLFTKSTDALKSKFYDLKEKHQDFARIAETSLNRLGYVLLRMKKTNDAVAVFKINVQAFPDSWNVYDSLGEAYMESGNKRLAIKNYEKSIELNPDNTNAKEKLQQLKLPGRTGNRNDQRVS